MRWVHDKCPECGEPPKGTLEVVQGLALLQPAEGGGFEYKGETEMLWASQKTVTCRGRDVLLCENGHEWQSIRAPD
ncbi:MAG: hypothetical protein Q8P22_11110 [Chloroflexota bacterium]|nr:hypothetical protein [Chloroflexota bacterium]